MQLLPGDLVKLKRDMVCLPLYEDISFSFLTSIVGYMHPRDAAMIVNAGQPCPDKSHRYVLIFTSTGLVGQVWSLHVEKVNREDE